MQHQHRKILLLNIIPAMLGIVLFLRIYGLGILNITSVNWIKNAGGDLEQSYYGWMMYRNSPWHFPVGLMENAAYPYLTSIIYIDSVPLFNLIFKIFRFALPADYQFFGVWGLVCFVLSGILGTHIIYELTNNDVYAAISSLFFISCDIAIVRLYTHTALAANWLILAAIYVLLVLRKEHSAKKHILYWFIIFYLAVGINIYYLPILGVLFVLFYIAFAIRHKRLQEGIAGTVGATVGVIGTFWFYGGFYQVGSGSFEFTDLSSYNANLNTFFNPMETNAYLSGHASILKSWPLAWDSQYEGYAYLGAGCLFLLLLVLIALICTMTDSREKLVIRKYTFWWIPSATAILLFTVLSSGGAFTFNEHTLFQFKYPDPLLRVLSFFRSCGRFAWGTWNIVMIGVLLCIYKIFCQKKKVAIIILCAAACLQLIDLYPLFVHKREQFRNCDTYHSSITDAKWDKVVKGKKHFAFMNTEGGLMRLSLYYDVADVALKHHMSINDFYYSRRLSELIDSNKQKMWDEIRQGQPDPETIYVFSTAEEAQRASKSMHIFYNGDLLLGTTGDTADILALKSIEPCNLAREKTQEGSTIYDAEPGLYYIEIEGDNATSAWIAVGNEESNSPNALMDDGSLASMMVQVKDGEKIRLTYGTDTDLNVRIWKVVIPKGDR